jgi:hypothetical protein
MDDAFNRIFSFNDFDTYISVTKTFNTNIKNQEFGKLIVGLKY